jgi:hypothetical protein
MYLKFEMKFEMKMSNFIMISAEFLAPMDNFIHVSK